MGFKRFILYRILDALIPGAGLLLDAAEAYELIETLRAAGQLSGSDAAELALTVGSMAQNGQEIQAAVITDRTSKGRQDQCHRPYPQQR